MTNEYKKDFGDHVCRIFDAVAFSVSNENGVVILICETCSKYTWDHLLKLPMNPID